MPIFTSWLEEFPTIIHIQKKSKVILREILDKLSEVTYISITNGIKCIIINNGFAITLKVPETLTGN